MTRNLTHDLNSGCNTYYILYSCGKVSWRNHVTKRTLKKRKYGYSSVPYVLKKNAGLYTLLGAYNPLSANNGFLFKPFPLSRASVASSLATRAHGNWDWWQRFPGLVAEHGRKGFTMKYGDIKAKTHQRHQNLPQGCRTGKLFYWCSPPRCHGSKAISWRGPKQAGHDRPTDICRLKILLKRWCTREWSTVFAFCGAPFQSPVTCTILTHSPCPPPCNKELLRHPLPPS